MAEGDYMVQPSEQTVPKKANATTCTCDWQDDWRGDYPHPSRNRHAISCPLALPSMEQAVLLDVFVRMLKAVTRDGGKKRAMGVKPPWWQDPSHEAGIFSHLSHWKHGSRIDRDSGAHPLVHLAWRALAIAYIETHGMVDPEPL